MIRVKLSCLMFALAANSVTCIASTSSSVAVYPQSFVGGWALDSQFMDIIGSPCLLSHGMGRPVPDARAQVEIPETGRWHVAVRAKNWLPQDCDYSTHEAVYPGSFHVLVGDIPLNKTFGRGPKSWSWQDGGELDLPAGKITVTLRDIDGFDGRCGGVVFYRGKLPFASDSALDIRNAPISEHSSYDFVVVGGGVPGCCAAVAAARAGLKTALVQDRPVLGGNSSSEIRVWSAGEQRHPIVKELRSLFMNRDANNAYSDQTRLAILQREPNLTLFLSHRVFAVEKNGANIRAAKALDLTHNRIVAFEATYFADATGDGWLGYYAGADYRQGREAKSEFGEKFAPDKADRGTLGASIMWSSSAANADVPFSAPWAEKYACGETRLNGEWNWEYGLDRDVITEGETVRDRLLLAIYGAFSRAKRDPNNSRYMLTTCPFLLGKRESRRLMGDWIYKEEDVTTNRAFEDAIATGSWSVDLHYVKDPAKPFLTRCEQPHFGRYWIPYRSIYSRNINNLFLVGRCFSCTHVGLGGPRVICTLSQMGVAAGEAAAMCRAKGISPRELYAAPNAMRQLQRKLGGDWPGNPDPAKANWIIVDDEDASATFGQGWKKQYNCNGGQYNNQSTKLDKRVSSPASPIYTFKAVPRGRYTLKALSHYQYDTSRLGIVSLTVESAAGKQSLIWNQRAHSGEWLDLGECDLSGDVRIIVSPIVTDGVDIVLDAFALVP